MEIAVRGYPYTPQPMRGTWETGRPRPSDNIILTLDTETTTDEKQTLRFGSCSVHNHGALTEFIIFYNDSPGAMKKHELKILEEYAREYQVEDHRRTCNIELMTRTRFIIDVLMHYCYWGGALLVCFNDTFDVARLAIDYGAARGKYRGGFSFKLSTDPAVPRIAVKHISSTTRFIGWKAPSHKRKSQKKHSGNPGRFLDLKTLTFALTNEHYNLEKALEAFQCIRHKKDAGQHGKIKLEYIDYNINDTLATHELYEKALARYKKYHIYKDPSQIFSPASIGKAYLEQMGVKPFLDKNPDFCKEFIGYQITAYYGARVEVKHRREPVKVTNLDFTSMYPSLYVLIGLDKYLKADKIRCEHNTGEIQQFLNTITIDDLQNKDTWKKMVGICRLKPNDDVLPVRANFSGKDNYNIAPCYVDSTQSFWYAIPDLIASKIFTGKAPVIEEAITFIPEGVQPGLKPITIFGNIEVTPEDDFIKKLIEERSRIKKSMQKLDKTSLEYSQLDTQQGVLKIIANSTAYGIFIELTVETLLEKKPITVYGLETLIIESDKTETPGPMFNPVIGVTITAGAKLILALAESFIKKQDDEVYYCDTDSVLINPKYVQALRDWFQPLNPYSVDMDMFKVEMADVWFYGISDKRYCLYDLDSNTGKFNIRKSSLHGLGYMLVPGDREEWAKQAWTDILTANYHPEKLPGIRAKYARQPCAYQQSITTPEISKRCGGLAPFNFIIRGVGYQLDNETGERINPVIPFVSPKDKRFKYIVYQPFYDPRTGKKYTEGTESYWKTMDDYLFGDDNGYEGYADHPEYKLDGDTGRLKRKHIVITQDMIVHMGKESNNWEKRKTDGTSRGDYWIIENPNRFKEKILSMTNDDALMLGIDPGYLRRIKARLRRNGVPSHRLKVYYTKLTKNK